MPPPKFDHAWIVKRLTRQLERQLDDSIFVADSNFGLVIRKTPLTQRTPDIAVFRLDRRPERPRSFYPYPRKRRLNGTSAQRRNRPRAFPLGCGYLAVVQAIII